MEGDKRHMVIVTPGFPHHESDTTCLPFLQDLIKGLKANWMISIITEDYPVKAAYEWHGLPVYTLRNLKVVGKVSARFKVASTLQHIHENKRIDLVQVFWYNWAALKANSWCIKNNIHMVLTFAGREPLLPSLWVKRFHALRAYTIAVSEFQKEHLTQSGYCVDQVIEWSVPSQPTSNNKEIDLLWCGSMLPVKRPEWFLQIVEKLRHTGWKGKAVMIGEDQDLKWRKEVERRGLETVIECTGLVPLQQVYIYMQRSKVFVHTAAYEAYGRVLAEALANKCAIVSTPVGLAYDHSAIYTASSVNGLVEGCLKGLEGRLQPSPIERGSMPEEQYNTLYKRLL